MTRAFLLGIVAGAALGAGVTLVCVRPAPPPAVPQGAPSADALEKALARSLRGVEGELRGIREAVERQPARAAAAEAPDAGLARAADEPAEPGSRPGRAARRATWESDRVVPPPPNHARLLAYALDSAEQRKWLFASERDALAWFGAPDRINGGENGETWIYDGIPAGTTDEEGNAVAKQVYIVLRDGRVIDGGD